MPPPAPVVAVIGGGQLARMMAQPAIALGVPLRLLAEAEGVSAAQVIPDHVVGDYTDLDTLRKVTDGCAVVTFDHEHVPTEHLGGVLALCEDKRGTQRELKFPSSSRAIVVYEIPLSEIVFDFYDKLKSVSRGYASLDYEPLDFREAPLVKLDLLINSDRVDDEMTTPLGGARPCSRAARLTVSPTAESRSSIPCPTKSPTTTSPVAMPIRTAGA